jgi:hypothetical protein
MSTGQLPCRLCHKQADLQESHIIPDFLYDTVRDEYRRLSSISIDPANRPDLRQTGYKELLLCAACENLMSKWEGYAKRVLVDGSVATMKLDDLEGGGVITEFSGVDYAQMRLFLLSMLWKMSVTKLAFFHQVNLSIKDENRIGRALLTSNPMNPWDYPSMMIALTVGSQFTNALICAPVCVSQHKHDLYWLIIRGVAYLYYVGTDIPSAVLTCALAKSGSYIVPFRDYDSFIKTQDMNDIVKRGVAFKTKLDAKKER